MKSKTSINQRIVRALETRSIDGMKIREIADELKLTTKQVYQPLWKLKLDGKISLKDHYYRLTTVNKPDSQELPITMHEPTPTEPEQEKRGVLGLKRDIVKLRKEIDRLSEANLSMLNEWRNARDSSLHYERLYLDALAVIKYLEAK